jgi:hypothetical protein
MVLTVTVVVVETADVQPLAIVRTVTPPLVERVMLCVVSPVLQSQVKPVPVGAESVTEPPVQKVVGPLAVMVGLARVVTETTVGKEAVEVQPLAMVRTV